MKSSLNKTVDVISSLVQKHVIINNKVKQNTLNQQNYLELDNRLDNLQKLIDSGTTNSIKFYKCRRVNAVKKTWEGYEVTFDSRGIANISTELTTGLQYTAVTPLLRQHIYSADGVQQVRGALMSGNLTTPCFYASYETIGGNINTAGVTNGIRLSGDGDNVSGYRHNQDVWIYLNNNYICLPGFPESASTHDWGFSIFRTSINDVSGVLRIGGGGASNNTGIVLDLGNNTIYFAADHNTNGSNSKTFTSLFSVPSGKVNLIVSYDSTNRKYTMYINGQKYAEVVEDEPIERPFNRFGYMLNNSNDYAYVYLFPEQITEDQAKLLSKQHWQFEGLQLSGLNDVYNVDYGMDVSPNGTLTESGTYMFKPKYYVSDPESGMGTCNIQWNGNEWEIFVYEYDENWNSIKKVIAVGRGGNDPSEAEWIDVGHGLAKIDAKYANNI